MVSKKARRMAQFDSRASSMNNTLADPVRWMLDREFSGQYNLTRSADYVGVYRLKGGLEIHAAYSGSKKYHFSAHCFIDGATAEHMKEVLSLALPQVSLTVKKTNSGTYLAVQRGIPEGAMRRREHQYALEILLPLLFVVDREAKQQ